MNTPRLALLVVWALLAPTFAFAGQTWEQTLQKGNEWVKVTFTDENGAEKQYWFRASDAGDHTPLYLLTAKPNPSVTGGAYYESVTSAYELKVTVIPGSGRTPSSKSYSVTRPGTALDLAAKFNSADNIGYSLWAKSPTATYTEVTDRRTGAKSKVRSDKYEPGNFMVVVAPPGDKKETLAPSPMGNFKPVGSPVGWSDYYFERPAKEAVRSGRSMSDPDANYRTQMARFKPMHRRVLPFEYLFDSSKCYVRPEGCADSKKADYARYIRAADQAQAGNILLVEDLAAEGHTHYKGAAEAFKAELDKAPENEFGPKELEFLQRLLATFNQLPAFQKELASSRSNPENLKLFVAKWRGYLKTEVATYLNDSEHAGKAEVDFVAKRAGMIDRAQKAAAAPLKPAAPVTVVYWCDPKEGKLIAEPPDKHPDGSFKSSKGAACVKGQKAPVGKPASTETVYWCDPKAGKVVEVPPKKAPKDGFIIPGKGAACKVGQKAPEPVAAKPAGEAPSFTLTAEELKWLTKSQADNYTNRLAAAKTDADKKKVITEFRDKVRTQLRPEGLADYNAALATQSAEAPAKVKTALDKIEMWGGAKITPPVGLSDETGKADAKMLEIQLSKDEMTKIGAAAAKLKADATAKKLSAAEVKTLTAEAAKMQTLLTDYKRAHEPGNGAGKSPLDPVALHAAVVAARNVLTPAPPPGKPAGTPAGAADGKPLALLTDEQKKFLTPKQLADYEAILKSAPDPKASDASVQAQLKQLTPIIETRKTAPYLKEPVTEANLSQAADWQKDQFCDPAKFGSAIAGETVPKPAFDITNLNALSDLQKIEAQKYLDQEKARASGGAKPKRPAACNGAPFTPVDEGPANNAGSGGSGIGNLTNNNSEPAAKEKSMFAGPYFTKPLVGAGVKGAMIGLIIGSLFGPVGLIAGPLMGAALFYGIQKYDASKAKSDE